VSAFPDVEFLEVVVSDTGVGISREDQKKLFTRFFRVESPATREASGTGLGLAIVKSIIEKLGGEIWAESQLRKGSAFHFTLPLVTPLPHKTKPKAASRRTAKKVLVVDDEADAAHLIERLLQRAGYKVHLAEDGKDAVLKAAEFLPDLITIGALIPGVNAFDTIKQIRQTPKTAEIPIIVLSVVPDKEQARQLGVVEYLDKPMEEHDLLKVVERALSKGRKILVHDSEPNSRQLLED